VTNKRVLGFSKRCRRVLLDGIVDVCFLCLHMVFGVDQWGLGGSSRMEGAEMWKYIVSIEGSMSSEMIEI
jgi:hypothetical protein